MVVGVTKSDLDSAPDGVELSVIVPCLNEELNVPEIVVPRYCGVFEVGGFRRRGRARRRRVIRWHGVGHPQGHGVARRRPSSAASTRGTWASPRAGGRARATARGKLVATLDADLQYQPEDLLRLRRELYDHGVDVVQGWRSAIGRERGSATTSAAASTRCSTASSGCACGTTRAASSSARAMSCSIS